MPRLSTFHALRLGFVAAILVCCLIACRSKTPTKTTSPGAEVASTTTAEVEASPAPLATVPLDRIGLVDPDPIDANVDAWPVETFNARAGKQLKKLKLLLNRSPPVAAADVVDFVASDFRGSRLNAADYTTVFADESFRVRRPASSGLSIDQIRNRSGFVGAITQLQALVGNASQRRTAFKITSVNDSRPIETTIQFEFVGESDEGVVQHSSEWSCVWTEDNPEELPRIQSVVVRNEELTNTTGSTLFADRTQAVLGNNESYHQQLAHGVDYWLDRLEHRFGINASGWQGLAVGDVNGDGLDDLYVCQSGGLPNRLFAQRLDGTAEDISAAAGVDYWDHSHAALFLDLDGDADQDLVLATALGLIFMSNNGSGQFAVKAAKLCPQAMPFTIAAADYDRDGDLDIYASCYSPRGNAIATEFLARPVPYHDANNGGKNCLFRNEGNWQFKNVTRAAGLDVNNHRFSLAASWEDYDNDGDQDLYVANDYGRNNLYRNDDGQFTDVAKIAGVEDISAGMSVSWADYNQDGWMDLYVSNMWSSAGKRIAYQRQFQPATDEQMRADLQRHARGNSLFMNRGDGTFSDVSVQSDVTMGRWAWCSQFVDLNNDSRQDLVVANGFITQDDDRDL